MGRRRPESARSWRKPAILVAGLAVVAAVDVLLLTRGSDPEEPAAVERPDLRAAALLGCYVLRTGPWSYSFPSGAAPARHRLPPALEPPARVALLADSADRHGRDLASFRAEAIPAAERPERDLRWTVRADTLWLVWSEPGARAGAALFAGGDSLAGTARGVTDSVDARGPAAAWPINCSTLGRERGGGAPRR